MFGMGMPEIILILAIALIVLGPKKLPEIAKSLGRGIAEFKKATTDFKQSINADDDFKEAKNTLNEMKGDINKAVHTSTRPDATAGTRNAPADDDDVDDDDIEAPPQNTAETEEEKKESPTDQETPTDKAPSNKAEEEDEEKGPSTNA